MRGHERDIRHTTIDALVRSLEALANEAEHAAARMPEDCTERRALQVTLLRARREAFRARLQFGRTPVSSQGTPSDLSQESTLVGDPASPPRRQVVGRTPVGNPPRPSQGPALPLGVQLELAHSRIAELERERAGDLAFQRSVSEALNTGDGVYRP